MYYISLYEQFIFHYRTNKKIPRGPPSPPAPVMHSPNRKVCVLDVMSHTITCYKLYVTSCDDK